MKTAVLRLYKQRNIFNRTFRLASQEYRQPRVSFSSTRNDNDKNNNDDDYGNLKIQENNPFNILGIPKNSSYEGVKRRFIDLALQHHPDVVSKDDDDTTNVEEFIRLRQAFEAIRESSDGSARLAKEDDSSWSDDNFQAWFYEETGHQDIMFKMDLGTRKEVIEIANSQAQGGLDKGGMWEMARIMAQQQEDLKAKKSQHSKKSSVGLESGSNKEDKNSSTRRRRRRK